MSSCVPSDSLSVNNTRTFSMIFHFRFLENIKSGVNDLSLNVISKKTEFIFWKDLVASNFNESILMQDVL